MLPRASPKGPNLSFLDFWGKMAENSALFRKPFLLLFLNLFPLQLLQYMHRSRISVVWFISLSLVFSDVLAPPLRPPWLPPTAVLPRALLDSHPPQQPPTQLRAICGPAKPAFSGPGLFQEFSKSALYLPFSEHLVRVLCYRRQALPSHPCGLGWDFRFGW